MKVLLRAIGLWGGLVACWASPVKGGAATSTHRSEANLPIDTLRTAIVVSKGKSKLSDVATATPQQGFNRHEMQLRGITSIGDAMNRMAGVNLRDYGGAGGLLTVNVRGLGAAHTAVSYDGLSVSDARQGMIDFQRFQTEGIASLQLQTMDVANLLCPVRQLGSALVSITSLQPDTAKQGVQSAVRLTQGAFATYGVGAHTLAHLTSRTAIGAAADYLFARNDYPYYVANGVESMTLHRTNSRLQRASVMLHGRQCLQRGALQATLSYYHNHRQLPGQVVLYVQDNHEQLTEQEAFAQLRWTYRTAKWSYFAAGKYNYQRSLYRDVQDQYPDGELRQDYQQGETYLTGGLSAQLGPYWQLAYAMDWAHNGLKSNQLADAKVNRLSTWHSLSLRWQWKPLTVTARGVYQYHHDERRSAALPGGPTHSSDRQHYQHLTPSLTAVLTCYRRSTCAVRLRAGYKESYRMPSFTEAYYMHLGSQQLKPEWARQFNGGATLECFLTNLFPRLTLTADAYYNRVTDRIVSVPYNLFVWRTVNFGRVDVKGIDVTAEMVSKPAEKHRLLLCTNYTYQQATDRTKANASTYGKQLAYTPRHAGSASLSWENPWVNVAVHSTMAAKRESNNEHLPTTSLPAYAECGASLFRTFKWRRNEWLVRADVMNAFNKRYEVVRRYPMPGRAYRLSVTWQF